MLFFEQTLAECRWLTSRPLPIRRPKVRIGQPFFEAGVVAELFEELSVVGEHGDDGFLERAVVFEAGGGFVGVFDGVLVGFIRRDLGGDFHGDDLADAVRVRPGDGAEQLIELFEDVGERVDFRLGFAASAADGNWAYLRVLVVQRELERFRDLDAITVHVNGFEDALGQIVFLGRRQFGDEEVQEYG